MLSLSFSDGDYEDLDDNDDDLDDALDEDEDEDEEEEEAGEQGSKKEEDVDELSVMVAASQI